MCRAESGDMRIYLHRSCFGVTLSSSFRHLPHTGSSDMLSSFGGETLIESQVMHIPLSRSFYGLPAYHHHSSHLLHVVPPSHTLIFGG